jgi:segregation and condensation protein A
MLEYRVNLDVYNGPMDLLLYLIRREEVDIHDIPVARITEQYLAHVERLQQIEPDMAGEFLVLAATLLEIKTRMLLPAPAAQDGADGLAIDPRAELVRQLLQYKAFKDAATELQDAADGRAARFSRPPANTPDADPAAVDLENVQVWDLVEAFSKILESIGHRPTHHEVIYDDTPLELLQEDLLDRLEHEGPLRFSEIFAGRSRGEMVGLFLALLELVRLGKVVATQEAAFGEIHVYAHPESKPPAAETAPASRTAAAAEAPTDSACAGPPADGAQPLAGQYVTDAAGLAQPALPQNSEPLDERGSEDQGTGV